MPQTLVAPRDEDRADDHPESHVAPQTQAAASTTANVYAHLDDMDLETALRRLHRGRGAEMRLGRKSGGGGESQGSALIGSELRDSAS
jgi:hypothetical protein